MGGKKFDNGKIAYHYAPWDALAEVMKGFMEGGEKYGPYNYMEGIAYSRYFNASIRHLCAWWRGQDIDSESTTMKHHLVGSICSQLMALNNIMNEVGTDDRPSKVRPSRPVSQDAAHFSAGEESQRGEVSNEYEYWEQQSRVIKNNDR